MDDQGGVPIHIQPALRKLVQELVLGNFADLEADGRAGRLSAPELRWAIAKYGRVLIDLPEGAFSTQFASAIPIDGDESVWAIDVALWTREEGRSDLTLQVTAQTIANSLVLQIEDLHVL